MASIRCGSCRETHGSVYAVKVCHQIGDRIRLAPPAVAPLLDEDGEPIWCGTCDEVIAEGRAWYHVNCWAIP